MSAIYAVNCHALLDADKLNTVLPLLDDARRQKVQRLAHPLKRAQSAAAGLLTAHLLNGEAISYDSTGRPTVPNKQDTHISITHTDEWVFCAISGSPIGIDAQIITQQRQNINNRLFSKSEQRAQTDADFTRIWTCKEAFYKLSGCVPLALLSKTDFLKTPSYDNITDCYYHCRLFPDNIYITACSKEKDALPNTIIEVSLTDLIK